MYMKNIIISFEGLNCGIYGYCFNGGLKAGLNSKFDIEKNTLN